MQFCDLCIQFNIENANKLFSLLPCLMPSLVESVDAMERLTILCKEVSLMS